MIHTRVFGIANSFGKNYWQQYLHPQNATVLLKRKLHNCFQPLYNFISIATYEKPGKPKKVDHHLRWKVLKLKPNFNYAILKK